MCLIITGPAKSIVSTLLGNPMLLQDIYESNGDGVGVMYANSKRKLRVYKSLPKSWQQAREWVKQLPNDDRMLAMHWRWRTHGEISLDQCHPYHITDSLAMMHNGVLHTGNAADTKKSDTWHFIQDYLADIVAEAPKVVHKPSMVELIGEYIGDNRFVFMDGDGEMTIVNEDQGITHGDLWFSNTYAWCPELLIPTYRRKSAFGWGGRTNSGSTAIALPRGTPPAASPDWAWTQDHIDKVLGALGDCDADQLGGQLRPFPYTVTQFMMSQFVFSYTGSLESTAPTWLSKEELEVCEAMIAGDATKVSRMASTRPERVAECICYYLVWSARADDGAAQDDEYEDAREDEDVAGYDFDYDKLEDGEMVSYGSDGIFDYELFSEGGTYGYSVYCGASKVSVGCGYEDRASAEQRMRSVLAGARKGVPA